MIPGKRLVSGYFLRLMLVTVFLLQAMTGVTSAQEASDTFIVEGWSSSPLKPDTWSVGRLSSVANDELIVTSGNRLSVIRSGVGQVGEWQLSGAATALGVVDIDGDGIAELLVGMGSAGSIFIYGTDESSLIRDGEIRYLWAPVRKILAGDVTGDGWPDVVALNADGDAFLFNWMSNGYQQAWRTAGSTGNIRFLELVDMDGNGLPEVIIGRENHVAIMKWDKAQGTLVPVWENYPWGEVYAFVVADMDGDGRTDLILSTSQGILDVFGWSSGTYVLKRHLSVPEFAPLLVGAVDLHGDGRTELVAKKDKELSFWRLTDLGVTKVRSLTLSWSVATVQPIEKGLVAVATDGTVHWLQLASQVAVRIQKSGKAFTPDFPPVVEGKHLWLSVADWSRLLDTQLMWTTSANVIHALRGFRFLSISPGKETAYLNGRSVTLEAPARVYDGLVYLPVEVGLLLGGALTWDPALYTLSIQP